MMVCKCDPKFECRRVCQTLAYLYVRNCASFEGCSLTKTKALVAYAAAFDCGVVRLGTNCYEET